jgi:TIR domain-containing protein/pentapeptide repeat protein
VADKVQLKVSKKGAVAWNKWRKAHPEIHPDLSYADLHDAKLGIADLGWTDLKGANLSRAELIGANLSNANLIRSNLSGADISGANLNEANVADTVFADIDLSRVKGLETIKHTGPSPISISTIYRSKGKIPFEFLRGAGVPDNFIEYMHSLTGTAFEYYSCFISYSSKDQPFAERLHADLQARGVRCWFAPHHGRAGEKLHEQIDQAIRLHEKLLLILSPASIKSEWVTTEIKKAARRQTREKKDVLFPVALVPFDELRDWECWDGDLGKDLAGEIREYLIPDFSRWKEHDSYQKEFAKLLKDLRSGKTKAAAALVMT